ncbi:MULTISPECIES: GGDEF domain-containing protein [Streptacidiphilus]|uniref:GGDEF domain-containing protein n=1 Tax=Streptacidiphilus cavernicola TaxID=3342716 RepID=A0ABV6ULW4_9ACTN|nr:GGDEF domain-containing protein [Streptacidiphilus jeojiense]
MDLPTVLSAALAALLLTASAVAAVALVRLRRVRGSAAASELSLRQELQRLQQGRAELERTSYTDALTGVWNYRYLQLALDREIARCARRPVQPEGADRLSVLLLEIEGFDEIRREHGHQRGGAVLRDLAQRLAMEVRETDVFGRYGGEEFLVLLPDTDAAGAEHVAERLRWTVRRHPLALPSVPVPADGPGAAPVNGLGAVVGTAVLPRDGAHAALLLRAADRALAAARAAAADASAPPPSGGSGSTTAPESTFEPMSESVSGAVQAPPDAPTSGPAEAADPGSDQDTCRTGDQSLPSTAVSQPVYRLLAQGCDLSVT